MTIQGRLEVLGIQPVHETYQPLTAEEIEELESYFGVGIPPDYLHFVQKYGGSYFPGKGVVVRSRTQPPEHLSLDPWLDVAGFFGGGHRKHRLRQYFDITRGRMPDSLLPIATDYTGNLFCVGVRNPDRNLIYCWDFQNETSETDYREAGLPPTERLTYVNLILVAESFPDFLSRLEPARS